MSDILINDMEVPSYEEKISPTSLVRETGKYKFISFNQSDAPAKGLMISRDDAPTILEDCYGTDS